MAGIKKLAVDFLNSMSSEEGNAIRYRIIYAFCVVVHAFYAILFACVGIRELMLFNIASTIMYLTGMLCIRNNRLTLMWLCLLSAEIMAHEILCGMLLGFKYEFSLYSLSIIPVTFFISFLDPRIKHPFVISSILAVLNFLCVVASLDTDYIHTSPYDEFPRIFVMSVSRFNIIIAVMILISFSVMFISKINYDFKVLKENNDALDRLANYDQLTGLRNRNHIRDFFELYIKSTDPYCVILGDIDDFKRVNDTFGHTAGDDVLKAVSSIIRDAVGDNGVVCRWGGEEILILLKGSTDKCIGVNEDILQRIRNKTVESGKYRINVTMTFGLCDYGDAMDIEKLISLADKRLYIGKKNGKNRIVTHG